MNTFSCTYWLFCMSLGKCLLRHFANFLIRSLLLLLYLAFELWQFLIYFELWKFLIYFVYQLCIRYILCKHFLPFCCLPFHIVHCVGWYGSCWVPRTASGMWVGLELTIVLPDQICSLVPIQLACYQGVGLPSDYHSSWSWAPLGCCNLLPKS